ncbi:hypothetical protein RhiXN_04810 [Rhizoctonia solani]|uniref:Uncharacterized protein n=1 Tax=Rhizoctonia solani TaxID=456999 RepID=A0A8H8NR28_9AGAM|nr:uncharacterized protein RhiXN_04810 [Rhizoctonia solani]QRW16808.1 hypothetical protein RhiXN_04810 [Rhizoctonia solani]
MAAWYTPGGSKVAEWVWNGVEVYWVPAVTQSQGHISRQSTLLEATSTLLPLFSPSNFKLISNLTAKRRTHHDLGIKSRSKTIPSTVLTIMSLLRSSVLPKTNEVKPPRNPTPSPASSPSSTNNNERVRKYSKMRTLRLPGKPTRPIRLPTENELAVRRANERAAIEACQRDKYCARELAGDGLFIHAPATRTRPEPGAIEYCHVILNVRQDPLTTPYISDSSELSPFVSAGFSSSSIDYTEDESNEDRTPFKESKLGHIVKYKRKIQEQGTKRLNKIRTNMSDWLATIGAGNNKLVADDVAQKAGPVLRASPILTPLSTPLIPAYSTCSSDASAPDTPIEEFYLASPITMSVWAAGRYAHHQQSGPCSHA